MALITENNTQYYVGEQLFVVDPAALSLSLIHISEPTRPY